MSQITSPPNCGIFGRCVFGNFLLADETFGKNLRIFETFVPANNNLCGKLISSLESPTTFDERFRVT